MFDHFGPSVFNLSSWPPNISRKKDESESKLDLASWHGGCGGRFSNKCIAQKTSISPLFRTLNFDELSCTTLTWACQHDSLNLAFTFSCKYFLLNQKAKWSFQLIVRTSGIDLIKDECYLDPCTTLLLSLSLIACLQCCSLAPSDLTCQVGNFNPILLITYKVEKFRILHGKNSWLCSQVQDHRGSRPQACRPCRKCAGVLFPVKFVAAMAVILWATMDFMARISIRML